MRHSEYKKFKSLGFVLDSTKSIDDDLGHILISKTINRDNEGLENLEVNNSIHGL